MTPYLFVYGSLMTAMKHPMGERLRREATLMGPAQVQGRLYRVSWYPGLQPSADPADVVHGEVYHLNDPVTSLAWLDEYEGIKAGQVSVAATDEYTRVEIETRTAHGAPLQAWIYLYQRSLDDRQRVLNGVWGG